MCTVAPGCWRGFWDCCAAGTASPINQPEVHAANTATAKDRFIVASSCAWGCVSSNRMNILRNNCYRVKLMPTQTQPDAAAAPHARLGAHRWLLFVHQLPASPSNLRVRTWRRLQQLGAVPVKQALYVLPDSPTAREDFEWLKAEVKGVGGDATVFA